jgi:hypothetical protein
VLLKEETIDQEELGHILGPRPEVVEAVLEERNVRRMEQASV